MHANQRGRNAGLLSDLRPFSPAERRKIRADLQAFYDRFLDCVADGRGLFCNTNMAWNTG